jgi:hypothetical protein
MLLYHGTSYNRWPLIKEQGLQRYAVVRIPLLGGVKRLPNVSASQFDRWCNWLGHAAVARFINHLLNTGCTLQDVYSMRRRGKPISSSIRWLVRDLPTGTPGGASQFGGVGLPTALQR